MHRYKIRVQEVGALGFLTQADHYRDVHLESDATLESFAATLAAKGFWDEMKGRWVMPGSILWIEPKDAT